MKFLNFMTFQAFHDLYTVQFVVQYPLKIDLAPCIYESVQYDHKILHWKAGQSKLLQRLLGLLQGTGKKRHSNSPRSIY